ncbi:hypothetical protein [Candidatus Fokinia crypta]|nr:hypothetical protein [Candidatus Fokinia cryptica]
MSKINFMLAMLLCVSIFLNKAYCVNEKNVSFGFGTSTGITEQIRFRYSDERGSVSINEELGEVLPYYFECSYGRNFSDISRMSIDVIFSNIPIQKMGEKSLQPILKCYGVMIATKLFIPSPIRMVPYLNVGIGYGWYDSSSKKDLFSKDMEEYLMRSFAGMNLEWKDFNLDTIEKSGLLWKLGAGIDYRLNSNLSLFLQTGILRQPSLVPHRSFSDRAAIRWRGLLFGGASVNF